MKRKPCGCGTPGCFDMPELTAKQLKKMKPFSTRGARETYATREVLTVGKMADGEPYFRDSSGGVNSFAISAFCYSGGSKADLEQNVLDELRCKPGDRVECVVTLMKMPKGKKK